MRRGAAFLAALLLLLTLFSCKPNNVLTPVPKDTQTEPEPEKQPEPENEPDTEELSESGAYLASKKENTGARPTVDIDGEEAVSFKTPQLKDRGFEFYIDDGESGWNIDQLGWFEAIKKEYGILAKPRVIPASTLYSAQLIAVKSGIRTDLITCSVEDSAASLRLMQNIGDVVTPKTDAQFSARVFQQSGFKLIAPRGFCKMLWYDKNEVNGDPLAEFRENVWTAERLAQYGEKPLASSYFAAFGSAGALTATGVNEQGYFLTGDDAVYRAIKAFGALTGSKKSLFFYELGPELPDFAESLLPKNGVNCAVPIPRLGDDGKYVASFAGRAMGVSVTAAEDIRAAAAAFAVLWAARATEARADSLLFKTKMTPAEADAYLTACDRYGDMYEFDRTVNDSFDVKVVYDNIPLEGTDSFAEGAQYRQGLIDALNAVR